MLTLGTFEVLFTTGESLYVFSLGIFDALTGGGSVFGIFVFLGGAGSGTVGTAVAAT